MELIIVILLVVIIYQLTKLGSKNIGTGKPTFTKEERDKAASEFYLAQYLDDAAKGLLGMPEYSVWTSPPYDEVKDNPEALDTLREMSGRKKNS